MCLMWHDAHVLLFCLLAQIMKLMSEIQDRARKKFNILCPKFVMDYMGCLDVADHKMVLQNLVDV
jgi:hypothetical protein